MKKAIEFFNQMSLEEREEWYKEFRFQKPFQSADIFLQVKSFRTFENFLDNSFDHREIIRIHGRPKYTFWFNVMIKYNVSAPTNFNEL